MQYEIEPTQMNNEIEPTQMNNEIEPTQMNNEIEPTQMNIVGFDHFLLEVLRQCPRLQTLVLNNPEMTDSSSILVLRSVKLGDNMFVF